MTNKQLTPPIPKCDPAPYNHTAYIVAGGPSLKGFNWNLLNNVFTVGINRAYEVLPNAEVIYFTDEDYYNTHIDAMLKHKGRLIKGCVNLKSKYHDRVERFYIKAGKGLDMTPGHLFHGRNSTFAALNMVVQWGFKKVYLMGVDMKWGKPGDKKTSHWHSGHRRVDGEATYKNFKTAFIDAAPILKNMGIEVININNDTGLTIFPIVKYEDHFGPKCFRP